MKQKEFYRSTLNFHGIADDYARFIEKEQLLDELLWESSCRFLRIIPTFKTTAGVVNIGAR